MGVLNESTIMGASGVVDSYTIGNSCRFDKASTSFLSRTPSSAGNRKTWTWSGWLKLGKLSSQMGTYSMIFGQVTGSPSNGLWIDDNDRIYIWVDGGVKRISTLKLRDPNAWYHMVMAVDTTSGTAAYRFRVYINNVEVTSWSTDNAITQNNDLGVNASGSLMTIGKRQSEDYYDGLMAEIHFIDGTQLTPSAFGEAGDYGEWKPKEVSGLTYGTNGFHLPFSNTGTKHAITAHGDTQHSTTQEKIGNSSIAFDGTGDYLRIPKTSDFNWTSSDFTIEAWVYITSMPATSDFHVLGQFLGSTTGNPSGCYIYQSGAVACGRAGLNQIASSAGELTTGQWYHVAWVKNGSTTKIYKDGTEIASATTAVWVDHANEINIGKGTDSLNGFFDEIRVSNTARYTSGFTPSTSAFTEDANTVLLIHSDTTNGSTTFTDSSGVTGGLGNDASANSNHFALTNITTSDQMTDSPTNNFAVMNTLDKNGAITFSEGNLKLTKSGATWTDSGVRATFGVSSGKWYFEMYHGTTHEYGMIGITQETGVSDFPSEDYGTPNGLWTYEASGTKHGNTDTGSGASYGADWHEVVTMSCALNMDDGEITFYKGGSTQGVAYSSSIAGKEVFPMIAMHQDTEWMVMNFGQDGTFAGNVTAGGNADGNGYGNFKYAVPSGFLALCSQNLPDPAVIPSKHFNAVTYTGDGSQDVTGVGFQPDLVWCKTRDDTYHFQLHDSVRGATAGMLNSNQSAAENSTYQFDSFDSDGFTTDSGNVTGINASGDPQVAWCWKAGTTTSGTTSGVGTGKAYSASYNASAGFSIVSYLGNGSVGHTIPHHLGVAPELMIMKGRAGTDDWYVYSSSTSMGNTKGMQLSNTGAANTTSAYWNDTSPTSSVWTVSNNSGNNSNDAAYIAYCFTSVEGFSKVGGEYAGNGSSSDGTFVYTGFRPSWICLKRIDGVSHWRAHTSGNRTPPDVNGVFARLEPSGNGAEATSTSSGDLDFLSNGFKIKDGTAHVGASGNEYLYIAFAKTPFSHSNAV